MGLAQVSGISATKERTITERLNDVYNSLDSSLYRIEAMLAKVNGTPQGPQTCAAPTPQHGLNLVVEHLEEQARKAMELVAGIERIA